MVYLTLSSRRDYEEEEEKEPEEPGKPEKPDCPKCPAMAPAWMATFADMATLLMAFFVLILSFVEMEDPSIFKEVSAMVRAHVSRRLLAQREL